MMCLTQIWPLVQTHGQDGRAGWDIPVRVRVWCSSQVPRGVPLSPRKVRAGGVSICRLSLAELCGLVINRQERRFHYAGMSGEGVGRESAPFLAPASPAALIDVPCTTAASPGGRRPLHRHSPLLEEGQQPDVLGLWGAGRGAGQTSSGPGAAAQMLSLYLLFLHSWAQVALVPLFDLWPVCPWALTQFRVGDGGPHPPCPTG